MGAEGKGRGRGRKEKGKGKEGERVREGKVFPLLCCYNLTTSLYAYITQSSAASG